MDKAAQDVFNLIKNATGLSAISDFLKSKGLSHSGGSWDFMYERRIAPAYDEGKISFADLVGLLRDSEEHARQHVFLYGVDAQRAKDMIAATRVEMIAKEQGLTDLLAKPEAINIPDQSKIVDIRFEDVVHPHGKIAALAIKEVERRESHVLIGTEPTADGYRKVYGTEYSRAVNIARLYASGLLEIRIAARDNTSKYQDDVKRFFKVIGAFFPEGEFTEISLRPAKNKLWNDRKNLDGKVRYGRFLAKNDEGISMVATVGKANDSLTANKGAEKGLQAFIESDGYGHSSNVYFRIPDTDPVREVHVLVSGDVHEFALLASCSSEDYRYVLEQILFLNQP
ncbi:hypothetical protein CDL60_26245 [Roseateles noduli]|nr:hypothetical protein CDL60_26245 [Roseateles noduli]